MLILADSAVDSSRKVVTRIMLNQEETFRNQVCELHRLHQKQKILMKERTRVKVSCELNFSEETEVEVSRIPMISSSRSMTNHCPQNCIDLNNAQDFLGPSHVYIPSELSVNMKYGVHENKPSSMEGLELYLGLGSDSLLEGLEHRRGDVSCDNISAKRKLFASHEVGKLDLNKPIPDESYFYSNDHYISNSSSSDVSHNEVSKYGKSTFFTVLDCREPKYNFSNTNSTLTTSTSNDSGEKTRQKISSMSELNVKKSKEENHYNSSYSNQLLIGGSNRNKSPISRKSYLIKDDLSSNSKTGQCGIDKSNSNVKSQSFDQKKEEFAEIDLIMKRGAASLIYFSSSQNQDDFQEAKRVKQSSSIENEVPQSSSESYEAIVLKQEESEYCVSSTPYEVTSALDERDHHHGLKFKRGRRMKDFRKEILPGLASLSRDEICEDVQIMKLAIRSRENKKCRFKNATVPSTRSRRSRLSYVGTRHYS